jgi:hypothetical protein
MTPNSRYGRTFPFSEPLSCDDTVPGVEITLSGGLEDGMAIMTATVDKADTRGSTRDACFAEFCFK